MPSQPIPDITSRVPAIGEVPRNGHIVNINDEFREESGRFILIMPQKFVYVDHETGKVTMDEEAGKAEEDGWTVVE